VHAGTPNLRAGYQSYFAITQGPGVVALRTEMIHDTRVFPISSGAHVSKAITMYHGDSRAHWDGDTLGRGHDELLAEHELPRLDHRAASDREVQARVGRDTSSTTSRWTIPRCGRVRGR
jgi:hypothetical protein